MHLEQRQVIGGCPDHDCEFQRGSSRADRALAERLTGTAEWRTERVRQVLPQLRAAVGSRPQLPTAFELERVRYTPITVPFKRAALLSHRIASKLGYSATDEPGAAEGILVDVAELWELFVLHCARHAIPQSFQAGTPIVLDSASPLNARPERCERSAAVPAGHQ